MLYGAIGRLLPERRDFAQPRRIVFIRPCCIGDVVMATAALTALRRAFPDAHITWAVGSWSTPAIARHPHLDAILDTGPAALPWRSQGGLPHFIRQLRQGQFDMLISLLRSPVMSLAALLSGIPARVGPDSAGRGFGYNLRVAVDPARREHESEIYLRIVSAAAGRDLHAYANLPVQPEAQASIQRKLREARISEPYIVAHPGGGSNPGASMDHKRYPPARLAALLDQVAQARNAALILLGGPDDAEIARLLSSALRVDAAAWIGELSFAEIAALSAGALLYIGNDSGLTHVAAAAGAATVMMMGPTDPRRYAPYTADHLVLWKPVDLSADGWDWERDGFTVAEGVARILAYLEA